MTRIPLALLLLVASSVAQEWTPFLEYQAEIQKCDPPPWMKEGTRLYWETAGSQYVAHNDPRDQQGNLGVHTSGAGILTADVVSLVGREAVVATRTQVRQTGMSGQGILAASVEIGYVTHAATGGVFWVHPEILAKAFRNWPVVKQEVAVQDKEPFWAATRGPYEFNGRQVTAIHWTYGGGRWIKYERFAYEEETGILLYRSSAPMKNTHDGRQVVAMSKFLGRRDRQLPWAMGRPPAWLTRIGSYTYSGSWTVQIPGVPPQPMATGATLLLNSVGSNFITLKMAPDPNQPVAAADPGGGMIIVAGPTQTGGLWLPPLEIPKLRAGMVVDRDEVLGATVTVALVGRSDYGRNVARIVEDAPGYTQYCDYERETGILLGVLLQDKLLNKLTELYFTDKKRVATAPGGR